MPTERPHPGLPFDPDAPFPLDDCDLRLLRDGLNELGRGLGRTRLRLGPSPALERLTARLDLLTLRLDLAVVNQVTFVMTPQPQEAP